MQGFSPGDCLFTGRLKRGSLTSGKRKQYSHHTDHPNSKRLLWPSRQPSWEMEKHLRIHRGSPLKRHRLGIVLSLIVFLRISATGQTGDRQDFSKESPIRSDGYLQVIKLKPGLEGARVGIRPRDILLRWTMDGASGKLESPFDLVILQLDQSHRGMITVEGRRGKQEKRWQLKNALWGISTRSKMSAPLSTACDEIEALARVGKLSMALDRWRAAKLEIGGLVPPWFAPWLLTRVVYLPVAPKWEEVDKVFTEAVEESRGTTAEIRAEVLDWWADTFHQREDFVNAEKYYQAELVEKRKLGSRTVSISITLQDLASVAIKRGNFAQADEYLHQALSIQQELVPGSDLVAITLESLGVLATDQGDLINSESYYKRAVALDNKPPRRVNNLVLDFSNLGELAMRRGDFQTALRYEHRALRLAKIAHANEQTATVLSFLGSIALYQNDIAKADTYQRQALAVREKVSPGTLAVAMILTGLGDNAKARGGFAAAEEYYRRALAIEERLGLPTAEFSLFLNNSGEIAEKRGRLSDAEAYYRRSIAFAEKTNPEGWEYVEGQVALARLLHRTGQAESAIQIYRKVLNTLESQTTHLGGSDEIRAGFRQRFSESYRDYADVLVEQGQLNLAFEVLEASRARTLLEMLARSHVDVRQDVDPALLVQEKELERSLRGKSQYRVQLLSIEHADQQLSRVDQEIAELSRNYHEIEGAIREKSPAYAALVRPQSLTVDEVRQVLDPNTILLEFSLGKDRSYVWFLSQKSLLAYPLPKRRAIEVLARVAYRCFAVRASASKENKAARTTGRPNAERGCAKTATDLSRMILGPVSELIKDKRLLIVSDGVLQYIPFAALPTPQPPAMTTTQTRPSIAAPLVVDHEIINLPSVSVLIEVRRQETNHRPAPKAIAVLADPVFDTHDERVERSGVGYEASPIATTASGSIVGTALSRRYRLIRSARDVGFQKNGEAHFSRLPYTRKESKAIAAAAGPARVMQALDFRASRATAMSPELTNYSIIHFATHGLVDSKNPELSGLVLSLVDRRGKPQEGFLGLEDIYNLKLSVEMVVLSACQTGLGKEINGEGLIGLTRGFMYAGASRVVASLWSVDDLTTSELMARFYRAMEKEHMPPAAALRNAQIEMWKQKAWRSPHYWAAFQVQGEWK